MKRTPLLLGLLSLGTLCRAATLDSLSLEELMRIPVQTVTGVSRYEQTVRNAPASITVLTSEQFADFGWRTVADGLRTAPGLYIRYDRFYDTIGFRGFSRPQDYNSRLLVLVDGQRVNDVIYQQGAIGFESPVEPALIDRVEVIRGPASSIYGSNAFFGVINVVTKRPSELRGGEVAASIEYPYGGGLRAFAAQTTPGGVEWRAHAAVRVSEGENQLAVDPASNQAPGAPTRVDGHDREEVYRGGLSVRKGIWFFDANAVQRTKRVPPNWVLSSAEIPAQGRDERAWIAAGFEATPDDGLELVGRISVDHYDYSGRFGFYDPLAMETMFTEPAALGLWANGEFRAVKRWEQGHALVAGVEYTKAFQQRITRDNVDSLSRTRAVDVDERTSFTGVFAQGDLWLTSSLLLSAGIRHDYYEEFGGSTNPRAGVVAQPWEGGTLKLLYGRAFRVPNVDERFAQPVNFRPNPNLGPESSQSWEFTVIQTITDRWIAEASAFRVEAKDLISLNQDPGPGGLFFFDNRDAVRSEGLGFAVEGSPYGGWKVRASYTWQRVEDTATGIRPPDAPEHMAYLNLGFPLPWEALQGGYECRFVSGRSTDVPGLRVRSQVVHDLSIRTGALHRGWELRASVRNLFDAAHVEPIAGGVIDSPGRSFSVEFISRF
jgi:iron complex outermembrane receptor protein